MIVSIVIPTYQRGSLLTGAVRSCLDQSNIDPNDYEIVVVDNCPNKSSQGIVADLMRHYPAIKYISEPKRGIASARNAGVAASQGEYIAFLDDDELATPNWLHEMLKHGSQGSVAVFGPIREIVSDAMRRKRDLLNFSIVSRFFERPDGDDVSDVLYDLGTGNSLFNKRQCFGEKNKFDEKHNFAGGEDIDFLSRLRDQKIPLVWAKDAWVEEYVADERLTTRYLMRRRFHAGQARTIIEAKYRRFGLVNVVFWMAVGCVQIMYYGALYLIALVRRRDTTNFAARTAGGAGKLLFFYRANKSDG